MTAQNSINGNIGTTSHTQDDEQDTIADAQVVNTGPVRFTNWKHEPTLLEIKQDYDNALPIQSTQVTRIGEWLDNLHVRGKAKINVKKGNSAVVPKLIRKQAEWRYAALSEPFLSTDDIFKVKPVTWEDREAAQQNQLVLNHQFNNKINKVRFIDSYVRTGVDEGTIVVKVGWEEVVETVQERVPEYEYRQNPAYAEVYAELDALQAESPSQYATDVPKELKEGHALSLEHQVPYEPVIIGEKMESVTKVVINRPTLEICDYRNVTIDPTCKGDISKASFITLSFESCMSDLKKDGRYKNLEHVHVNQNSPLAEPDHAASDGASNFNFADKPRTRVVVREWWGFRDIDGSGVVKPILVSWIGSTIIRMEENPFPDKQLPFVVVQYLPVRNENYGEPDGVLIEDNQKIAGAVTRGMIDLLAKSANGQTGMRRDMLDVTNRRKFDSGEDYEFNMNVDPRVGVHMHTYPEIPNSAQYMLNLQNMEAESLTGVKSFSQGVSGDALGEVAAGVRGALDAASKRELGILRRLSAGIVEIGRKIISMNSEFLSEEEVIRITNDEFVKVRRDDLAGNFDLRLTISTAEEDEKKAQELAFMLQTMGNNMDPEMTRMILSDIARLRKMPDLAKKIEDYQPQPDPLTQKRLELELAMLEMQIAETQAKTMNLQTSAGLNQAKEQTELAKARQLGSTADKQDLDYVEQEAGVTQERELQQHRAQAEAQGRLKLLDHYLKEKQEAKKQASKKK